MTEIEKKVYDCLNKLDIEFEIYQHKAVFTVEDADDLYIEIPGQHCKNLFLRNQKDKDTNYLLVLDDSKKADLKKVANQIQSSKFTFDKPEVLHEKLGLTPGSVSPFGLINNKDKSVIVLLDESLTKADRICFHPNINTATISLRVKDFMDYLKWCGNKLILVEV